MMIRRISILSIVAFSLVIASPINGAADKIRIGYLGMTISNALLWVTEEGKLFEKN
jgi:hypothetical protein